MAKLDLTEVQEGTKLRITKKVNSIGAWEVGDTVTYINIHEVRPDRKVQGKHPDPKNYEFEEIINEPLQPKENTSMLYQVGITAVKLQTGMNPQKKELLAQPEFVEANSANEAIVLYTHKMHKEIAGSKFDQLEVMCKQ